MKIGLKFKWLILLLVLIQISVFGQDNPAFKSKPIRYSIRTEGGISRINSSQAFKSNFYPTGDFGLSFQLGLFKGFTAGISFRYSSFQVDPRRLNVPTDTIIQIDGFDEFLPIRTYQNHINPGITLGYDVWADESVFFNFAVTSGISYTRYSKIRSKLSNVPKSNYNFQSFFIEPSASVFYVFEDNLGVSFKVAYTYIDGFFKPENIGLGGGVISYETRDLQGKIQFLTFSLGFVYSIKSF